MVTESKVTSLKPVKNVFESKQSKYTEKMSFVLVLDGGL